MVTGPAAGSVGPPERDVIVTRGALSLTGMDAIALKLVSE
jgi:hypothetical protein